MSQILIHSKFGVLECKPMVLADIEHDSVPESDFTPETGEDVSSDSRNENPFQ